MPKQKTVQEMLDTAEALLAEGQERYEAGHRERKLSLADRTCLANEARAYAELALACYRCYPGRIGG